MLGNPCPCGSTLTLQDCCNRFHQGALPSTAGQLMRSRYSAYVLGLIDYLIETTLPAQQALLDRDAISQWSLTSQWLGLAVEQETDAAGQPSRAQVCFSVRWQDNSGEHSHRELSNFVQSQGRWYFLDPTALPKSGRNDPCPCGSGQKFKKCCSSYLS